MAIKTKVPVREQDPKVRATNFEEVCYGYNSEEAQEEAQRCLNCKNPRCDRFPIGIFPLDICPWLQQLSCPHP